MAGLLSLHPLSMRLVQDSFLLRNFSRLMNFSYASDRSLWEKFSWKSAVLFLRRETSLRKPGELTRLLDRSKERRW